MSVLFTTHVDYLEHLAGRRHPERPERLQAVIDGAHDAAVADALVSLEPREATLAELAAVHDVRYLDELQALIAAGGGDIDGDTGATTGSWRAAVLAAGAGLAAVEALEAGTGGASAAFCAVRPPGHHATPQRGMGFCLLSNVAVVATSLAARGERVAIVDYDAHHGNGTQAAFYDDPRVLYVSLHQWPLYPRTGWWDEVGDGDGRGTTMNIPMPPGATGDVYVAAIDELVVPAIGHFAPDWLIISAGFDAHRRDPITDLGLSSHDYALITARLLPLVPAGRRLVMLEGGYDLDALSMSTASVLASLEGRHHSAEAPTSGGPGRGRVSQLREAWADSGLFGFA